MEIELRETLRNFVNNAKKMWIILLIIPVITGGALYIYSSSMPVDYTAKASIVTGNFEQGGLSMPSYLGNYLKSDVFLKNLVQEKDIQPSKEKIRSNLHANSLPGDIILDLSYTSNRSEEASQVLEAIIDQVIKLSEEKIQSIEESIDRRMAQVSEIKNESDPANTIQVLHNLEKEKSDLVPNIVSADVTISSSQILTPKLATMLGVVLGLFIDFIVIWFAVMFRGKPVSSTE